MFILLGSPNAKRQICGLMVPILWKRAFFNRWHHANCDQCLGTYVGRPCNCTTKDEKSKMKGICATGTGSSSMATKLQVSNLGPVKSLRRIEDYISIRCPDQNKITLQLVFDVPLRDFKNEFLDDRGCAPRDVHLRHRHRPYYAGASLLLV